MLAKITYMKRQGEWPHYYVRSRSDCKDATDRSAFDALVDSDEQCVQMGEVCIERVRTSPSGGE